MSKTQPIIAAPIKRRASVGRKRKDQSKQIRETPAGMFGERLAKLMEREGVTAKEMAEAIDRSEDAIWTYLRGTATPHINDWPKIARKLGLKDARSLLPSLPV